MLQKKLSVLLTIAWLVVLLGAAASSLLTNSATVQASVLTSTFTPIADAYVNQSSPSSNYGGGTTLRVDSSPIVRSYLRFNVQGIVTPISKVTLRVYANSASSVGYAVYAVSDNTWNESSITYNNAPTIGNLLVTSTSFSAGTWTSVDVTAYVTGNGTYNLSLIGLNATAVSLASRESGANAPQLLIDTGTSSSTATATPTPLPTSQPTLTPTFTPTLLPTATATPQPTPTATPTNTPTSVLASTPQTTLTPTPSNTPTAAPTSTFQPQFPIRAAFFYPWFPQAWTQSGIYPYTNYTPTLGFYSSTNNATIDAQLDLAAQAHLNAFIASWWGQGHHTDSAFSYILNRSEQPTSPYPNMRWAIYYELESQGDPTVTQIVNDLNYLNNTYFGHVGHLKVNNKPVVFVYADALDGCGMADRWVQAKNQFGGNLHLVLKVFNGYKLCASQPDSWHQYGPATNYSVHLPYSAVVSPGFWKKTEATPRLVRDPVRFESDVQRMVASGASWQLVTTWSEWGEGSIVEPAQQFGNTYIDILCRNLPGTKPCSSTTPTPPPTPGPTATPTNTPTPTATPIAGSDPVIAAAGDIACDPAASNFNGGAGTSGSCHMKATSDLLLTLNPVAVLTLGDNQYEDGDFTKFQQSYDPTWGRLKALTHPSVGNHEYLLAGATGYYQYFGAAAGDPTKGYYSYDVGTWHLIAINSNCSPAGGCGAGSPQEQWLRADLATHPTQCALAYWHHPRFSSGEHGNYTSMQAIWQALYDYNADVVLNGHDHDYERFAPQNPSGVSNTARGLREFVVGTGGKNHYAFLILQPNSEVRNSDTYGVLALTLHANSYDWQFIPEAGKTFTDSGTTTCH